MAERSIVDIGKYLERFYRVGQNPAFGGVGGGHSPTGYHPKGLAIDVTDWRPDMAPAYEGGPKLDWKTRTGNLSWRAKQLGVFNEALGPGDKGHDTHVHLALEGKKPISEQQLEWLATGRYKTPEGKLTDVMPGSTQSEAQPGTQPQTSYLQRKNDILTAYIIGAGIGAPQQEKKDLKASLRDQLIGQMLGEALNPTAFLPSYVSQNPFLQGQSAATTDFLGGLLG